MQEEESIYQNVLILPQSGRTALFGMTGSGKTILADTLRTAWLARYPKGKVLIVDSKPHYRAQWQLSGLTAAPLYRKWKQDKHDFLPGSYTVPLAGNPVTNLRRAYRKTRIVVAQGPRESWSLLLSYVRAFYETFGVKSGPRLIDVDEGADFFEVERYGGVLLQALRAGRQLDLGVLMGSQRPVFLPKSILTETDRLYLLKLKSLDDLKTIQRQGGLPRYVEVPQRLHEFRYYNFYKEEEEGNGRLFKLGGIE